MIRKTAFLCLLPLSVAAEPVSIRSGEHETFSRLVLSIGVGTSWDLSKTPDGYLLELAEGVEGFDLSRAFDRIPRDRIRSLTQRSATSLALEVDCDCFSEAFLWRPGELVLDIADGSYPDADRVEDLTTPLALSSEPTDALVSFPSLFEVLRDAKPDVAVQPAMIAFDEIPAETTAPTQLQSAETALIEGLARAATQGFLNAAITPVTDPALMVQDEVLVPELRIAPGVQQRPGIGISSASDLDLALVRDAIGSNLVNQCLPSDLFQIDQWGDKRPFHEQVAGLAEALAGEFGEEPLAAQDDLARLYIHFGFGAEARSVLAADSARSQKRQVLFQLAGLIDDIAGPYPLIDAQKDCDSPGALWAFFSDPSQLETESRNHVLQEFFSLPQPLRGQIAPRIARKFISIGDPDGAAKLMRASENLDADATHEVQSTRALIAEELDNPDEAITVLARQADDNARTTPQSLIRLIELELENDRSPRESDLILAAGMRQEYRNSPISLDLAVAESLGRTRLGGYAMALDLVKGRDDAAALAAIDTAFDQLTQNAPASIFLEFAFANIPDGPTATTENNVARRLIDLGFPERATVLLAGPAEAEAASERRYLRAEAAIATKNYVTVLEELLGMTDERSRTLRATAYTGLGDHRSALSAIGQNGTGTSNNTLQFRAGAWERLTVEDDEVLSAFAQTVLAGPQTDAVETLADRRAILEQSQESRRAVEALLLRYDGFTLPE